MMPENKNRTGARFVTRALTAFIALTVLGSGSAMAQQVRYSWLDLSYMGQDIGRSGSLMPSPGQTVDIDGKDGDGVRFRGSFGTWNNFYIWVDYGSTDIDMDFVVTSPTTVETGSDEFDYTDIRGGIGLKWSVGFTTDLYAELAYESIDFDLGELVPGANFDTDNQDIGGSLGVRYMMTDDLELRAFGRYSNHADVDLTTGEFDSGSTYGAGLSWQFVRGLSLVADYEGGEFTRWSLGFRLDLDEDQ